MDRGASLLAGVIAVAWPSSTLVVIAIIFAAQLLVGAVYQIELFLAIGHAEVRWRPWVAIIGILSIVAGGVVAIFPVSSLFFLTIFLGFWLVLFGLLLIVRGIGVRSAARVAKPMAPRPAG
jgi:uncharacterized membrane protein HdeD (DUF308 family)